MENFKYLRLCWMILEEIKKQENIKQDFLVEQKYQMIFAKYLYASRLLNSHCIKTALKLPIDWFGIKIKLNGLLKSQMKPFKV